MRYLPDLVKSLSDIEVKRVLDLPLRGKEKALFEWTCQHFLKEEVYDVGAACAAIKVAETTLFKLNSLLCNKILQVLVPNGGTPVLNLLSARVLIPLMYHEMRQMERKLPKDAPLQQRIDFYSVCFEMVLTTPLKYYDEQLIQQYYRKLSALADGELMAFVKARKLATEIYVRSAQGDQAKSRDVYQKKLLQLEKFIKGVGTPCIKGHFYLYRSYGLYYNFMCDDLGKTLQYVNLCKALFDLPEHGLREGEYILTEARRGECLYGLGQYQEAKEVFDEVFAKYNNHDVLVKDTYYHNKWVQLALITGDYKTAKEVLDQNFKPYIDRRHPTITTLASVSFAKYHLFVGEYEKALEYIQLIANFNKKNLYIIYEIELRNLHNAYFAFVGDAMFAQSLTKTNLRYLKRKNLLDGTVHYDGYYHVLGNLVSGKPLTADNMAAYRTQNTGFYGIYGKLLSLIAAKFKVGVGND